jgi:hypothetical protein
VNIQPAQERKNAMSRARTWIAVLAIGQLAACSSTFKEISPTPSSGQPTGKAGPFLNSPFFLAIETGVLVGGITQLYNWAKASSDRKLAEANSLREKQIAVLSSVTNDLPTYISTMGSMRKLRDWLLAHPNGDVTNEYGQTHDEIAELYTEFFKLHLQTKTSTSILAQVGSYYEDKQVCEYVNEENRAVERIHDAKNDQERADAQKAEEKTFGSLLSAMAKEIRQRRRNVTVQERKSDWCLGQGVTVPAKN